MLAGIRHNIRLKICYVVVVLISSYLIYLENIIADIQILRFLFNDNLVLIPYLFICVIGYIILFTRIFDKYTDNPWFVTGICVFLVILTIAVTFTGSYENLDYTNDTDEALEEWIKALFSGTYPYEAKTQLGNPITPFPFLPLYSIPYYLLGEVAIQNIINVIVIIFILYSLSEDRRLFKFALITLGVSLPLWFFLLTQSDHLTVAALIVLGIYLLYRNKFTTASIVFACLIASKGYAWLIIPVSLYWIYYRAGYKKVIMSIMIYFIISAALILPFMLWNPHVFLTAAPFGEAEAKISNILSLPYSAYLLSLIAIGLSLIAVYFRKNLSMAFIVPYVFLSFFSSFMFVTVAHIISLLIIMVGLNKRLGNKTS